MPTTALTPIGLVFPIRRGNAGYFQQSYNSNDQSRASLINLLSTMPGSRPLNPMFGSKLWNYVFSQEVDQSIIESVVQEDVAYWIPSIQINEVDVDMTGADNNVIQISVNYTTNNSSGSATIYITP